MEVVLKIGACGHEISMKCSEAQKTSSLDATVMHCESECNCIFDVTDNGCGHKCEGTCKNCYDVGFHPQCLKDCSKILICGHK